MNGRWSNYFLERDFSGFWSQRQKSEGASLCVISGIGFDPRSITALAALAECNPELPLDCVALCLRPPSQLSENYKRLEELTDKNVAAMRSLPNVNVLSYDEVSLRDKEGHLVGGRLATSVLAKNIDAISKHRDVVIDISGLPRTVFFPLIKYLCRQADAGAIKNLHVAVTEDSDLDGRIRSGEFGNPDFLYSFRPTLPGGYQNDLAPSYQFERIEPA